MTIDRIRAGREKPGLQRQHLTAVNAATEICRARLSGATIGSRALTFEPGAVQPGDYTFSVGTAGSASLVLQTVLPALLIADGPSTLVLEGGTHNPWAPPFDFLQRVFLPLVSRMGPRVTARLQRPGFYPAGRGRFEVHIEPSATLSGFDLLDRGAITGRRARVLLSKLPTHIARRELDTVADKLGWSENTFEIDEVDAASPGNVVFVEVESEHVTDVFTAFGRQGIGAERVAGEAATQARDYLGAGVPVGPYLADQLLLPLGISAWQNDPRPARRGGSFRTLPLTLHSTTHIDVLRAFLGIEIAVEPADDGATCVVHVRPPPESTSRAGTDQDHGSH